MKKSNLWQFVIVIIITALTLSITACGGGGGGGSSSGGDDGGGGNDSITTYAISGQINGLQGILKISNNGSVLTLNEGDSDFQFSEKYPDGSSYNVTVDSQPSGYECTVTNGKGVIDSGNITNVYINCLSYSDKRVKLSENSTNLISSMDNDSIIFSGTTNELKGIQQGDVIVAQADKKAEYGVFRKVVSVSDVGGNVVVETEQALVTDVVQDGKFKSVEDISPDSLIETRYKNEKLKGKIKTRSVYGAEDYCNNKKTDYVTDFEDVEVSDGIFVSGCYGFSLKLEKELDIGFGRIKLFRLAYEVASANATEISITASSDTERITFEETLISYTFFTPLGYIPATTVVGIALSGSSDGEITLSAGVSRSNSNKIGFELKDGDINVIKENKADFNVYGPDLEGFSFIGSVGVGPELAYKIGGMVGPQIALTGYVGTEVDINQNPWWKILAGAKLTLDVVLSDPGLIPGLGFMDFGVDINLGSHTLVEKILKQSAGGYENIEYNVTASAGAGGSVSPPSKTVVEGETASFYVTPDTDYAINNDYVGGTCPEGSWSGSTYTTGSVNSDCSVEFYFNYVGITTYNVTASAGTGGSVSPSSITVEEDDTASFTVSADSGYTIDKYDVGGTCPSGSWNGSIYTTGSISSSCSVSFSFDVEVSAYSVTASAGVGGSVTPSYRAVVEGDTASFTVSANNGYTTDKNSVGGTCPFGSWSGSTYTTGAISSNCSISFSFNEDYDDSAERLVSNEAVADLSGSIESKKYFYIEVPENAIDLEFWTYGGTGDVDIYISHEVLPTLGDFDYRGYTDGNSEMVGIDNPEEGRWYLMLYGFASYSGVSAYAEYESRDVETEFTVTARVNNTGTVTPETAVVVEGERAEFVLVPNDGYYVVPTASGTCGAGTFSGNTYTTDVIMQDCWVAFSFVEEKEEPVIPESSPKLKKTGQTTSYADYDDGWYQAGVEPSYSRANDIVTDEVTGLMWQDDADAGSVEKDWQGAIDYCDALSLGGHSDWRLPSIEELETIVDFGRVLPSIDLIFQNVDNSYYWSSTTNAYNNLIFPNAAWSVSFSYGNSGSHDNKSNTNFLRCVRSGE